MNTWKIRLLAGAACTAGLFAAGATMAQAAETHHGLLDVKAVVKIGDHKKSPLKVHVGAHVGKAVKVNVNVGHRSSSTPAARTSGAHVNVHLGTNRSTTSNRSSQASTATRRTGVNVNANVRLGGNSSSTGGSNDSSSGQYRKPVLHLTLKALPLAKADVVLKTRAPQRHTPAPAPTSRPAGLSVKAGVHARILNLPVNACVRLNASSCKAPTATPGAGSGTGRLTDGLLGSHGRSLIPSLAANADAVVLNTPVDACVRLNARPCGTPGTGTGTGTGTLIPPVLTDVDGGVLDIPVLACIRLNSSDCSGTTGVGGNPDTTGSTPVNPVLPVIGGDLSASLLDSLHAALCLRINGGSCAFGTGTDPIGDPGTPTAPGNPSDPGNNPGDGHGNGGNPFATTFDTSYGSDLAAPGAYGNGGSQGDRLAHTGAGAGLLVFLLGGLFMIATGGVLLSRIRRT